MTVDSLDSGKTTVTPASTPRILDNPDGHAIGDGLDYFWLALWVDLLLDLDELLHITALAFASLVDEPELIGIFKVVGIAFSADLVLSLLLSGSTAASPFLDLLFSDDITVIVGFFLNDFLTDHFVANNDHSVIHGSRTAHSRVDHTALVVEEHCVASSGGKGKRTEVLKSSSDVLYSGIFLIIIGCSDIDNILDVGGSSRWVIFALSSIYSSVGILFLSVGTIYLGIVKVPLHPSTTRAAGVCTVETLLLRESDSGSENTSRSRFLNGLDTLESRGG